MPTSKLEEAKAITPGFKSPTVSKLDDAEWRAVRSMVSKKELHAVMDKLEALGAAAIIETRLNNLPSLVIMEMTIRPVSLDDATAIAEIYNYYIQETAITFEEELLSFEDAAANLSSDLRLPLDRCGSRR